MLVREATTQAYIPQGSRDLSTLLGMVALEDQGDGIGDHPLPCIEAHPTVLPRNTEQQVCGRNRQR